MKEKTKELHLKLLKLVEQQRVTLSQTLELMSELNRRKGFVEFGHPSLLKYCVKELGLSESASYRRIKALKIVDASPSVKRKLEEGKLNLAQISKAQELFNDFRQEKGEKVPQYKKEEMLEAIQQKDLHNSENEIRKALNLDPKPRVICIKVNEETYQKWNEIKGKLAHKNMSDEMLLRFAIEKMDRVEAPKRIHRPRQHNPDSRYIPAHIKRKCFQKSGYKCAWKGCQSVYGLEIDHIRPVSKGGKTVANNLRVLCRNHNQARNFD